jgi:hypothetical protein
MAGIGWLFFFPQFSRHNPELRAAIIPPKTRVQKMNSDTVCSNHGEDYSGKERLKAIGSLKRVKGEMEKRENGKDGLKTPEKG